MGNLLFQFVVFGCFMMSIGRCQLAHSTPLYYSHLYDPGNGSNRPVFLESDKPIDAVLQAILEMGNNVFVLVPPSREYDKRDPPDLGTARSYTGQRTAKVFWGQLASNSPSGPGKRKLDSHDDGYRIANVRPNAIFPPEQN